MSGGRFRREKVDPFHPRPRLGDGLTSTDPESKSKSLQTAYLDVDSSHFKFYRSKNTVHAALLHLRPEVKSAASRRVGGAGSRLASADVARRPLRLSVGGGFTQSFNPQLPTVDFPLDLGLFLHLGNGHRGVFSPQKKP